MAINNATLKKTHSDYDANSRFWDFFWQSYEGGADYITGGNLIQHPRGCLSTAAGAGVLCELLRRHNRYVYRSFEQAGAYRGCTETGGRMGGIHG